jgi:hypothetical protein
MNERLTEVFLKLFFNQNIALTTLNHGFWGSAF